MQEINLDNVLKEIRRSFEDIVKMQQATRNQHKLLFICLDVDPADQEAVKDRLVLSDSLHQLFLDRKDLRLVLSFDSLEIFCFACDLEILDEDITRQFATAEKLIVSARTELLGMIRDYSFAKYSSSG